MSCNFGQGKKNIHGGKKSHGSVMFSLAIVSVRTRGVCDCPAAHISFLRTPKSSETAMASTKLFSSALTQTFHHPQHILPQVYLVNDTRCNYAQAPVAKPRSNRSWSMPTTTTAMRVPVCEISSGQTGRIVLDFEYSLVS